MKITWKRKYLTPTQISLAINKHKRKLNTGPKVDID